MAGSTGDPWVLALEQRADLLWRRVEDALWDPNIPRKESAMQAAIVALLALVVVEQGASCIYVRGELHLCIPW